jgi:hypothetical protein
VSILRIRVFLISDLGSETCYCEFRDSIPLDAVHDLNIPQSRSRLHPSQSLVHSHHVTCRKYTVLYIICSFFFFMALQPFGLWPPFQFFDLLSRDSSVSIATGYGLDDRRGGSSSPGRVNNFHFSISSRPALGTGGSFPGVNRQGRETDYSRPTSA